jgi:hypothetical protein
MTVAVPPPPIGGAPPSTPGEDIVIRGLTWPKLLAIIGTVLGALGITIYVLLGVVYGGIQERFDTLSKRIQGIDDNFHSAGAAATDVKDLLEKSPRIEQTINDTRSDVATIKAQVQTLQRDTSDIKLQLQSLQETTGKTPRARALRLCADHQAAGL